MTYVWKCKRIYRSVAWRMCGFEWDVRERTDMLHHICVEVQMTLLSHPPTPHPAHNNIFIIECKKWQQSRASQMPGTKNMILYIMCIYIIFLSFLILKLVFKFLAPWTRARRSRDAFLKALQDSTMEATSKGQKLDTRRAPLFWRLEFGYDKTSEF